jgi:hypothetical protein
MGFEVTEERHNERLHLSRPLCGRAGEPRRVIPPRVRRLNVMSVRQALSSGLALAVLSVIACGCRPAVTLRSDAVSADTVLVAPPVGERALDRASILSALDQVRPGGTILFAPGTYLVGEMIPIETPRITMQGDPEGTTLRACEPDEYHALEQDLAGAIEEMEFWAIVSRCGMFNLTGGHVAIRGFTFEYTRLGILLGCCHREQVLRPTDGGYRIEENTFRNVGNGIRAMLDSTIPSVIRDNRFINVFHALSAPQASHIHFLDNDMAVPEPSRVPAMGYPSFAIAINALTERGICEHNLVARNRIEGHPTGIRIGAGPGGICRDNVIRNNTIIASRVQLPTAPIYDDEPIVTNNADQTFFGVPVELRTWPDRTGQLGVLENNLIEGNRVVGAHGVAILVSRGSRGRVVNNEIVGVATLDPFPGNFLGPRPDWPEANGSGIWISAGSEENEIAGNTFVNVAAHSVVVAGDRNVVELRGAEDSIRDLGNGNQVRR